MCSLYCLFFFFQAEDGIRDVAVTGVQTCALPISATETGEVLRLETAGGHVTWRRRLPGGGAARAGPVPAAGGLAVATTADTLYLLDRATGEIRSRLPTPGAVLATPAFDARRPYLGTPEGHPRP